MASGRNETQVKYIYIYFLKRKRGKLKAACCMRRAKYEKETGKKAHIRQGVSE
jgi:hypothetical protein